MAAADDNEVEVRIWGARGSIPVPGAATQRVGGNTACVEVRFGGRSVILDGGSGLRALGAGVAPAGEHHIFLTHFHWDHVQGVPFFAPLYDPMSAVHFYSAHSPRVLEVALAGQMAAPFFPVGFATLGSQRTFAQALAPVEIGGLRVECFPLHHPGGAHGYAVSAAGKRVVYATDHEHGVEGIDAGLLEVAAGADLLIYDAHYTPEEYRTHGGWGHSTWLEATRVAKDANVKKLLLFHHSPEHDDLAMDVILAAAQEKFSATELAVEGFDFLC